MRLELTGRQFKITPTSREAVERRIAPVLRRLNDSALSAQVVLTTQKTKVHAEITLHARGVHFLHGEALGRDVTGAIGAAADKIERQAERLKGKMRSHKGEPVVPAAEPVVARAAAAPSRGTSKGGPRVIRSRRTAVKPMSVDDALTLLGDGDNAVVVFRNARTEALAILFRRHDGNMVLIEPEI